MRSEVQLLAGPWRIADCVSDIFRVRSAGGQLALVVRNRGFFDVNLYAFPSSGAAPTRLLAVLDVNVDAFGDCATSGLHTIVTRIRPCSNATSEHSHSEAMRKSVLIGSA